MRKDQHGNQEYVNARFGSLILQYVAIITMVLIAPLGLLYALIGLLVSQQFIFTGLVKIMLVINCIAWFGMTTVIVKLKKYWVFKITINHSEITSFGFLRNINAHWSDIMSIEVVSTGALFGGNMVEVKTKAGNFFFPLTMKDKKQEYPKLDLLAEQWVSPDGSKKPISIENCSLYTVIKERSSKG